MSAYPSPMDIAEAEDREADSEKYLCVKCGQTFWAPVTEGFFDHDNAICDDCWEAMQ